jgi:ABC-2 type transport system permease protein
MLPSAWQTVSLFNPAMYLISGFRWAFFGIAEVSIELSVFAVLLFAGLFLGVIWYIFKTGYRLRN